MTEKIDIHDTDTAYEQAIEFLKNDLSKVNAELILDFLKASSIGKTARRNVSKKQAGTRARLKNLYLLKISAKHFDKDLTKLTIADMEGFIETLNNNKLKKQSGEKYSEQTKSNIKKTLIQFLRYHLGESKHFFELTNFIETSFKKKEIPALTEEEIKKLLLKCATLQQKLIVSFLFDSGCRIEEFLNIRFEDLVYVDSTSPYYRVTIRNEFSKTAGRTISLLWKDTTPIIKDWLEINKEKSLTNPILESTYDGIRSFLYKIGKSALHKRLNPHLFRHSSATYYASIGVDYFQLCKRYGWAIGSNIPNTYIDRSGIKEKEIVDKVANKNILEVEEQMKRIQQESNLKAEQIQEQQKVIDSIPSIIQEEVLKALKVQRALAVQIAKDDLKMNLKKSKK